MLAITARQVTAICKGVAKVGFVAEVKIGDVFIHLMPAEIAQAQGEELDPDNPGPLKPSNNTESGGAGRRKGSLRVTFRSPRYSPFVSE